MCNEAVGDDVFSVVYVPDWFVTQQLIKSWHDNDNYHDNDEIIESYESYQKCKAKKATIKEELLPIAWHPSRYWDWCRSEDEKQVTEKLWT